MKHITRHISVPTVLLAITLGTVIGYTAMGQRAIAPDAPVIAVVRIDGLFEDLQQRADARIELLRLEREFEDEQRRRMEAITKIEAEIENVVAVARRTELADEIMIKKLQMRFWQQEATTELEVEISLPFISADENGPRHLSRSLTRSDFEGLVGDLVERTTGPCVDALQQAGLQAS